MNPPWLSITLTFLYFLWISDSKIELLNRLLVCLFKSSLIGQQLVEPRWGRYQGVAAHIVVPECSFTTCSIYHEPYLRLLAVEYRDNVLSQKSALIYQLQNDRKRHGRLDGTAWEDCRTGVSSLHGFSREWIFEWGVILYRTSLCADSQSNIAPSTAFQGMYESSLIKKN